eukprot:SAG11_NODE_2279_length_3579_cov_6.588506_3_plen_42_part_00
MDAFAQVNMFSAAVSENEIGTPAGTRAGVENPADVPGADGD